jgi:hypothetical protein
MSDFGTWFQSLLFHTFKLHQRFNLLTDLVLFFVMSQSEHASYGSRFFAGFNLHGDSGHAGKLHKQW